MSLASMLTEISKLEAARAIDLPERLFAGIDARIVADWRARASIESPSHLRAHRQSTRLVLLTALVHQRQREITDTLVELWGGDATPAKESHFEIAVAPTDAHLDAVARRIRAWNDGPGGQGAGAVDAFDPARLRIARSFASRPR